MVVGLSRERRVAVLEMIKRGKERGPISIPMIVAAAAETSDAAVTRYIAEHGPLPEVDDDMVNIIVLVPVAPLTMGTAA